MVVESKGYWRWPPLHFPGPTISKRYTTLRDATIIDAGQLVLRARERHPEGSLAEHYNPLAMDQTLLKAHDEMDREVNKAFGGARKLTNERQRQELLFASYGELSRG